MTERPFFVGYLPLPAGLRLVLLVAILAFVGGLAGLGLALGLSQDAPAQSGFRWDYGQQTVTGVVELTPYPLLRVTEGNDRIAAGRTLMLTGEGKYGAGARAAALDGQRATVTGVILQRGTLDMLQLAGGAQGIVPAGGNAPPMPVEPLGRWRLAGEICDGKCLSGAMRPGRGLAHKACANLCLIGEVPPVFVASQPVEGAEFLLVTGPGGTLLPAPAYDAVGRYVSLEGDIERRGDLLVLRLDPSSLSAPD